jgi:ribonuclease-3
MAEYRFTFMTMTNQNSLSELERSIDYRFGKKELLLEAVTHKSFVHESGDVKDRDNQRLEFFGDAVLGFLVSAKLFERFPESGEGELSKVRASLVNEKTLARLAGGIALGKFLRLGRGEEKTGGREKNSVLADAYEALVAAVYLDGGAGVADELVEKHFGPLMSENSGRFGGKDYKTRLQEIVQEIQGKPPRYVLENESGPPHDRVFTVAVFAGEKCIGKGLGKSKKEAEQAAAREAVTRLRVTNPPDPA